MLSDDQLFARVAGLDVIAHDLSHDGDAGRIEGRSAGVGIGSGRFGGALELAEQIELIADREPGIGEVHHRDFFLQCQ